MNKLTYCWFQHDQGERHVMVLRAHLTPMDAMATCLRLGLPMTGVGSFGCVCVPDDLVELFAEHTERTLSQAKAQELFGDKWQLQETPAIPEPRHFHLGDILSIPGRLVAPRGMDGVRDILAFMASEDVSGLTDTALMFLRVPCAEWLLLQHPQLATVEDPGDLRSDEAVNTWVSKQVERFGETLPVLPLSARSAA